MLKKVIVLGITLGMLILGGCSIEQEKVEGKITQKFEDGKVVVEPLSENNGISGNEIVTSNLVISDTGISQSNGTYQREWSQPSDWKYYRFNVKNTTGTRVTVQIQENGYTQTYSLSANSSNTWTQSNANPVLHKIVVTTSDGRTFTGDVSVAIFNAPF